MTLNLNPWNPADEPNSNPFHPFHTMPFTDHVFATKSGVDLELRVFPARNVKAGDKVPYVMHVHGGAFVFCDHRGASSVSKGS